MIPLNAPHLDAFGLDREELLTVGGEDQESRGHRERLRERTRRCFVEADDRAFVSDDVRMIRHRSKLADLQGDVSSIRAHGRQGTEGGGRVFPGVETLSGAGVPQ